MQILHKTITADVQAVSGECYFVGAELTHSTATNMIIYDENNNDKTAAQKMVTMKTSAEVLHDSIMFPRGKKCSGIYVDWTAGLGTIYYHL